MQTILVLAPHADDEVLGCGGTIAKHAENDDKVVVGVLTNAAVGAPQSYSEKDVLSTRGEALRAHRLLGVHKTIFLDFPAPALDQYPQYKMASAISDILSEYKPDVLYVPHKGDLHHDHGAIYNAALVAARPIGSYSVKQIYSYETLSETEWGHPTPDMVFVPTSFNVLSALHLKKKLAAFACYKSQLYDEPHPRSLKSIERLAGYRGSCVSRAQAEAFMLVRSIL